MAVNPGENRIELGYVKFVRTTLDLILGLDWPTEAPIRALVDSGLEVPHVPGVFSYDLSSLAFHVESGHTTTVETVKATEADATPSLRVTSSTHRTLPNADTPFGLYLKSTSSTVNADPMVWRAIGDLEGGKTLRILSDGAKSSVSIAYGFAVSERYWKREFARVDVPLTGPGGTLVELGRVEVPAVNHTKPDGEVVRVTTGTYSVSLNGNVVFQDLPFGTGVDVLPSSYFNAPYGIVCKYDDPVDHSKITTPPELRIVTPTSE
jgi:hypothetical protein